MNLPKEIQIIILDFSSQLDQVIWMAKSKSWYIHVKAKVKKKLITLVSDKVSYGQRSRYGLRGACYGGHLELVKLMISKGSNDWNWGLYNACLGGHMEIVKILISKGATRCFGCCKPIKDH